MANEQKPDTPLFFCSQRNKNLTSPILGVWRTYNVRLFMRTEMYDLNGSKISIPIAESYKDCMTLIKSDRYRISGRVETSFSIIKHILRPFSSSLLFWLRLSQYKGLLYPLCKIMYARASRKAQVQIPESMKIGYGFYIGHNICMVINFETIIGNNVNINSSVNLILKY